MTNPLNRIVYYQHMARLASLFCSRLIGTTWSHHGRTRRTHTIHLDAGAGVRCRLERCVRVRARPAEARGALTGSGKTRSL